MNSFVASDLIFNCLSLSHKKNARRIWVNPDTVNNIVPKCYLQSAACIQMTTFDHRMQHYETWSDFSFKVYKQTREQTTIVMRLNIPHGNVSV